MKNHKSSVINHKSNTPIQYQKGYVEFYKLKFKVTPDVLIPRPETELLVDGVLRHIGGRPTRLKSFTILDVGTGAGNIAISIAKNTSGVKIIAADISKKALKVARQNAKLHGVSNQITFIKSDLLNYYDRLVYHNRIYPDVIVTNLPYIPSERIPYLDSSVKDFEPKIALDGGLDGFELYRKLFAQIRQKDWKPELIIGETDYTHGELAVNEALKYFPKAQVEVKTDLAEKQRMLIIQQEDPLS